MKIRVVVVGRVRGVLADAVAEYEERASRYWKLEVVEVEPGGGGREDAEAVMAAEGERILGRIPEHAELLALDRTGKPLSSRALARHLGERAVHALGDVAFAVGGAWGLAPAVRQRAARRISLGALTLPHEMARLVLAEQLYRAGTILRNEPYHKGRD
jgi:23S rRNA (pseudouridine1915-N3)-methyltransferase